MNEQISAVGILVASLAAMAVGAIWYSNKLFGKTWMAGVGITDKQMKKGMKKALYEMALLSVITSYVMTLLINHAHDFSNTSWLSAGIMTGLWVGLGIGVTTVLSHGILDPRRKQVLWINAGNRLITLLVMGAVLGYFLGL